MTLWVRGLGYWVQGFEDWSARPITTLLEHHSNPKFRARSSVPKTRTLRHRLAHAQKDEPSYHLWLPKSKMRLARQTFSNPSRAPLNSGGAWNTRIASVAPCGATHMQSAAPHRSKICTLRQTTAEKLNPLAKVNASVAPCGTTNTQSGTPHRGKSVPFGKQQQQS